MTPPDDVTRDCTCITFRDSGDLRNFLFKAACPVHSKEVFPPLPPEKKPVRLDSCGDCHLWMKSRECPKEVNVNGYSRGPSADGIICDKFVRSVWSEQALAPQGEKP
jgi:hypothetical protein